MSKTNKKTKVSKAKPAKKAVSKKGKTAKAAKSVTNVKKSKKTAEKSVLKTKAAAKARPKTEKAVLKTTAAVKAKPKKESVSEKEVKKLVQSIIDGMQEKKGENIVCLDLRALENRVCDFFVICEADNIRKVKAVCDSVEDFTTIHCNEKPWHVEGLANCQWVLMDYVNVVAHIFYAEARGFYGIEHIWGDAEKVKIN